MSNTLLCTNKQCPNASHCYRVTARPSRHHQSNTYFEYKLTDKGVICEFYIPDRNRR